MCPRLQTLFWLAAVLMLGAPSQAKELKIAAWNLEHLAQKNDTGCKPRNAADYRIARMYAEQLDADIVALSEVENTTAVARVFDPTKYNIEVSRQKLRAGYPCGRDDDSNKSTKQLTGFAIKKGIQYERNADFTAIDVSENSSLRTATDITIKGSQPLRILAVHLKASCPSKDLGSSSRDCQILARQQPILEQQWMEARYKSKEAFIVLGDFNRHLLQTDDQFWSATNDGEPAGLTMEVLSGSSEPICVKKYPKRIDHIIVDGRAKSWLKPDTFNVLKFETEGQPSDHCPISAVFDIK